MEPFGYLIRRLGFATATLAAGTLCSCSGPPQHGSHVYRPHGSMDAGQAMTAPGYAGPYVGGMATASLGQTQPGGQWIPPGIEGPWPVDEYVRDGGDRGLPARPGHPGEMLDLDPQDTVAVFDDTLGRTHVVPSNEVDIYAPRFGAVRSVSTLSGFRLTAGTSQFAEATGPDQVERVKGPESVAEDSTVAGMENSQRASGYDADLTPSEVYRPSILEGMVGTQLAAEQPGLLESDTLSQDRGAKHAEGSTQSVTWTHDKSAQAVVDLAGGNELAAPSGPQEAVTYGKPGGPPGTIEIVKSASQETAQPGDVVEFTLRYRNGGTTTVARLSLIDNLSPRLEYLPGTATSDLPAEFTATENDRGSAVLRWNLRDPVEAGKGGVVKFQGRVR